MKKQTSTVVDEAQKAVIEIPNEKIVESLDDDFDKFNTSTSEFKADEQAPTNTDGEKTEDSKFDTALADQYKISMFLGFICGMLSGANTILFNMVSKTKVSFKDMKLEEDEKKSIEPYLNHPDVLAFINKLPVWVIGFAHIEYMFFEKHSEAVKKIEAEKKETVEEITDIKIKKV